jgi:hypothetical protein
MPGLDRSGPAGQGSRTGCGQGLCGRANSPADYGFYSGRPAMGFLNHERNDDKV